VTLSISAVCPICERLVKVESRGMRADRRRQILVVVRHVPFGDDTGGKDCDGTGRTV